MSSRLFLPLLLVVAAVRTEAADSPTLKAVVQRDGDRVEISRTGDRTLLTVHSATGIGRLTVERAGARWLEALTVRLPLRGLESFQATNGRVELGASVSTQDGRVRVWKDGREEEPLDARHPFWIDVRRTTTAAPKPSECFDLRLPRALLADDVRSITVHWIDFFRN